MVKIFNTQSGDKPPFTSPLAEVKPRLRGWSHAAAAVVAIPLGIILCWTSLDDLPRLYSLLVFGLSMLLLYSVSAIFHIGTWRGRGLKILRAFDHANIFIFIAATYTPICFNVLPGWERATLLSVIWVLALAGVAITIFAPRFPRKLKTALYVGMGWVAVGALPIGFHLLPLIAISSLIFSGVLYTTGAVMFALRHPNPFPRFFGYHELFHLLVVLASALNYITIWIWIVPYPRV